jgi:hypothetical protein
VHKKRKFEKENKMNPSTRKHNDMDDVFGDDEIIPSEDLKTTLSSFK